MNNKLAIIVSKINLLLVNQNENDIERDRAFNILVNQGYHEIINSPEIDKSLKNTFYFAIEDFNMAAKGGNETYENIDFKEQKLQENTIKIDDEVYTLSNVQKKVWDIFVNSDERYIFSLPTSSGKSLLIRLLTKKRSLENKRTIIIAPTVSLLNEYIINFYNHNIVPSNNSYVDDKLVYVLTQERAINFEFKRTDMLMIDEAYVLSETGDRTVILYYVIKNALNQDIPIHMFMPNINNPEAVIKNKSLSVKFKVFKNFMSLSTHNMDDMIIKANRKTWFIKNFDNDKKVAIFDMKSNVIKWFGTYIKDSGKELFIKKDINYKNIKEILDREFGRDFKYNRLLDEGVIISTGDIPKIFRFFSEILYKNNNIKLIIANSTITKGVNLKPDIIGIFSKNFIWHDRDIDIFELRNALGRSGRYSENIEERVGKINFVGENNTLSIFQKYSEVFTNDSIEFVPKDDKKINYSFESKENIDWQKGKFGITCDELETWTKIHAKEIKNYINYKYDLKSKIANPKEDFDDVWDAIERQFGDKLYNDHMPYTYKKDYTPDERYEKNKKIILNGIKYQGFREALRISRTHYESAISEFNKHKKRNEEAFANGKIEFLELVNNGSNPYFKYSNVFYDFEKNKLSVMDFLIIRKARIKSKFIDAFLIPLDMEMARILDIHIKIDDEINKLLTDMKIPHEFKNFLLSKIKIIPSDTNNDILLKVKEVCSSDKTQAIIKYIHSNS